MKSQWMNQLEQLKQRDDEGREDEFEERRMQLHAAARNGGARADDHVAFHEAGHAVVAVVRGVPFTFVEVFPEEVDGEFGGMKYALIDEDAVTDLAGAIAQGRKEGVAASTIFEKGAAHDMARAQAATDDIEAALRNAHDLVEQNWASVVAVAAALRERGRLLEEEIRLLIRESA
jgi:hypothetical protein